MKNTLFAAFLVLASSCNSLAPAASASSPHDEAGAVGPWPSKVKCSVTSDALACLRTNCAAAHGQFNEDQKRCECGEGKVFSAFHKIACVPQNKMFNDPDGSNFNAAGLIFSSKDSESLNQFMNSNRNAFTEYPDPLQGIVVMASTAKELVENETVKEFLGIPHPTVMSVNFMNEPPVMLDSNANSGVPNVMPALSRFYSIGFFPKKDNPRTGDTSLDQIIEKSLGTGLTVPSTEYFTWYTEYGCIDQCVAYSTVSEDALFRVNRFRMYFAGGVIQDSIRVYDKTKLLTVATLFLFNGKLSYAIYQDGYDTWLHSNESSRSGSRIAKLQTFPEPASVPSYQLKNSEIPVAIFETLNTPHLDEIIPRGPWTSSHVYGWFKPEDEVSFYENYHNLNTNFGEDDVLNIMGEGHAAIVANLTSDQYQHPLIPFQDTDMMNGTFKKFLTNYTESGGRKLVASISESFPMSVKSCQNSPIANALVADPEHLLTVIGAGNSGIELSDRSFVCPQTLQSDSLIHVASSGDGNTLAPSSSRGANSVEIAELGCRAPGDSTCGNDDAATSFAAPRLARKVADLVNRFPNVPLQHIRFAVLATARAPKPDCNDWSGECDFKPLPVRSGGFMDVDAASELLTHYSSWPIVLNLGSKPWIDLLTTAKSNQFSSLSNNQIQSLVFAQATWFQSHSGVSL